MRGTDKSGSLWRNWKGYLVWAEPCRCATSRQPGYLLTILTGPRAGEREWRSRRDFKSPPHGIEGLPRYEPVEQVMGDPLGIALAVFRAEYPDAPLPPISWDDSLEGEGLAGYCTYADMQDPVEIVLSTAITLGETVFVLLHELAHVVVTPDQEDDMHGPLFQSAMDRLVAAYNRRMELYPRDTMPPVMDKFDSQRRSI